MGLVNAIRRPRTYVAVALLAVAIGVAAAWLVPPLGTGSSGLASGPPGGRTETGLNGDAAIYYLPNGRVAIGVEVRNTSFLPVTIEGLSNDLRGAFLLDDVALVLGTDPSYVGVDDAHTRRFEPVAVPVGGTQFIAIIGTFPPCPDARPRWSTGVGVSISMLKFDVRVAGVLPSEADVPLLRAVELLGDADAACP